MRWNVLNKNDLAIHVKRPINTFMSKLVMAAVVTSHGRRVLKSIHRLGSGM